MIMTRICFLSVCLWAFSGCGFTNFTIDEPYSIGQQLDSPIPETKNIFLMNLKWHPTYLRELKGDTGRIQRELKVVGVKKTMFGVRGRIYLNTRPEKWLAEGAKLQFKSVGLVEGAGNADDPSIFISVEQFFVEPSGWLFSSSLTAVIIIDVSVKLPKQGKIFERRFVGKESTSPMVWSDSVYHDNLLKSAQLAFHEAAQETRKLIDREEK